LMQQKEAFIPPANANKQTRLLSRGGIFGLATVGIASIALLVYSQYQGESKQ